MQIFPIISDDLIWYPFEDIPYSYSVLYLRPLPYGANIIVVATRPTSGIRPDGQNVKSSKQRLT